MVKSDIEFLAKGKNNYEENESSEMKYEYIWKVLPSYEDKNLKRVTAQALSLIVVFVVIALMILITTLNVILMVGMIGLSVVVFLIIFHNEIFFLSNIFQKNSNPIRDIFFWQSEFDKEVMFITNSKEDITTGVKIFQIDTIAENVHANLKYMVKALQNEKVSYTYQIIQEPLKTSSSQSYSLPFKTRVYFCTFITKKGALTTTKIKDLVKELEKDAIRLQSAIISNFHHFRMAKLSGLRLRTAFRTIMLNIEDEDSKTAKNDENSDISYKMKTPLKELTLKSLTIFGLSLTLTISLGEILFFSNGITFLIGCIAFIGLSLLWNRNLFTLGNYKSVFKSGKVRVINPFFQVQFFHIPEFPDTLFYYQEGMRIGGLKMFNLSYVNSPPFCTPTKFYEALTDSKIPYTLTLHLKPLDDYLFDRDAFKFLTEEHQHYFRTNLTTGPQYNNWVNNRNGIWSTMLTLSTSYTISSTTLDLDKISIIEKALQRQTIILQASYEENFHNYILTPLKKKNLMNGFLLETVKQKYFRRNGTHLNYIIFQGRMISTLSMISDQFKKGIETRIGAEFNTPLQLENYVEIGKTINTEILQEETAAGFTSNQVHNLLITNGTVTSRELTAMKLVSELVVKGNPSIVFDFTGNWTRLIRLFENTVYADSFLYFGLGKTFTINPLLSEVPDNEDNNSYLEYMLDALALCYKKDERLMKAFQNTFNRNPNISEDMSSMALDLEHRQDWEKDSDSSSLLKFINEFMPQAYSIIGKLGEVKKINPHDFILNDKTIIIDFSTITNYETQCFFTWTIISKYIHYLKSGQSYISKFLIIPHIDLVFDSFFLDKQLHYGRIDKFLSPLIQHNFGLVCSASQIRYLHSNMFNFFNNIVSFRATDKRDLATLGSVMSLDSLHGKGVYSSSRNEGYQGRYISMMKENEAVVKRDDIYQPFPIRVAYEDVFEEAPLEWKDIIIHMNKQGYDIESMEKHLIQLAKKTLFEKDFGNYIYLVEEVINFLKNLKKLEQVSHLTESTIKEDLYKLLHPKLLQITKSSKRMKIMRDELFSIMIKQGYLIESHPRRAGGGESVRTSYAVGPQYKRAIEDYFKSTQELSPIISVEKMDEESISPAQEEMKTEIKTPLLNKEKIKEVLAAQNGELEFDLFSIYKFINRSQYLEAIKIEKSALKKYIHGVYHSYFIVDYVVSPLDIQKFLHSLAQLEEFPFTEIELSNFIKQNDSLILKSENIEKESQGLYEKYRQLFDKLQTFIWD